MSENNNPGIVEPRCPFCGNRYFVCDCYADNRGSRNYFDEFSAVQDPDHCIVCGNLNAKPFELCSECLGKSRVVKVVKHDKS